MSAPVYSISNSLQGFATKIKALKRFDEANQEAYTERKLSDDQIYLLTEAIFFNAYREYENFLHEVFMQYCMEHKTLDHKTVKSFLKPVDFTHAESLVKSSMEFLDWTSPQTVIERSETYLSKGFPIKDVYSSKFEVLGQYKKIRNHIAHNSSESLRDYTKVVKSYNGTVPLTIPSPGEYLLYSDKKNSAKYLLLTFFDNLTTITDKIARG
jgi:hypothetical protein